MTLDAQWKVTMDPSAAKDMELAIFQGVQEVFELDIVPAAKAHDQYIKTGTNKRSIDSEVSYSDQIGLFSKIRSVVAILFTQSGYGGYLELGTKYIKARPYLYPAFNQFRTRIAEIVAQKIKAIRPENFHG